MSMAPACRRCLRMIEEGDPCILVARLNEHGYLCGECDAELMTWLTKGRREAWRRQDAELFANYDKKMRGEL